MATTVNIRERIEDSMYYFNTGVNYTSYDFLGSKKSLEDGIEGYRFTVWAPNAKNIELIGEFSKWQPLQMDRIGETGAWSLFVAEAKQWQLYKYTIEDRNGHKKDKQDPFALAYEVPPNEASVIQDIPNKKWSDGAWYANKKRQNQYERPLNIYEVHASSWKRHPDGSSYNFTELKDDLIPYVKKMGYTHIEFMPLMDHPLEASWGYQITGFFSIAGRFGHDILPLMEFVEEAHKQGIGIILDWVPGHYCRNDYALPYFDGTPTYEYQDVNRANNVGWGTLNFDLGKPQVQSFLISSATYWLETFHIDGLRIDAVSNMLYLDYDVGPWTPNEDGSNDNREGIAFLRKLNQEMFLRDEHVMMMAEESSSWPMVSRPIDMGGLGFNYKWNMGWMNDTLKFFEMDALFRADNYNLITFSFMYTFNENFILPISHDEVVHGKKSMLEKMQFPSGDRYRQFAHLRLFNGFRITHPGKKLEFMGNEIGQFLEWREYDQVEWGVLGNEYNTEFQHYISTINELYKSEKALHEFDFSSEGLEILDADNRNDTVLTYIRKGKKTRDFVIVILNFTPVQRENFRVGVPFAGTYDTLLNSENVEFGGTWTSDQMGIKTDKIGKDRQPFSLELVVPALSVTILRPKRITGATAPRKKAATVAEAKPTVAAKVETKVSEVAEKKAATTAKTRKPAVKKAAPKKVTTDSVVPKETAEVAVKVTPARKKTPATTKAATTEVKAAPKKVVTNAAAPEAIAEVPVKATPARKKTPATTKTASTEGKPVKAAPKKAAPKKSEKVVEVSSEGLPVDEVIAMANATEETKVTRKRAPRKKAKEE